MNSTHDSPDLDVSTSPGGLRFRAATIDAALADARRELGEIEIVEANRIRRGGVGGFFATDLGIEIVVRPVDERSRSEQAPEPDDEYVDTSAMPTRPPFYDRTREPEASPTETAKRRSTAASPRTAASVEAGADTSITTELERLLTAATDAERVERDRGSFAQVLATHEQRIATDAEPARMHRGTATDTQLEMAPNAVRPTTARPITTPSLTARPMTARAEAVPPAGASMAAVPRSEARAEAQIESRADDHGEPLDVPRAALRRDVGDEQHSMPPAAQPAPETAPPNGAVEPARRSRRTPTQRDPWRRSIDVAAGAVGRLVEQLSDVAPVEGSRMKALSRLSVSVTMPDGAVVEFSAELDG